MRKLSTRGSGLIKNVGFVYRTPTVRVMAQNFTASTGKFSAATQFTPAENEAMIRAFSDEQKEVVNRVSLVASCTVFMHLIIW